MLRMVCCTTIPCQSRSLETQPLSTADYDLLLVTGQLADTPTRGLPTRGLDDSRSGHLADWSTRGCHRRLCMFCFRSFGGICETASCLVRDLSSPRVGNPRVGVSASCPVTLLLVVFSIAICKIDIIYKWNIKRSKTIQAPVIVVAVELLTRGSAIAEGPRDSILNVSWNVANCCINVRKIAFYNACSRQMKVT